MQVLPARSTPTVARPATGTVRDCAPTSARKRVIKIEKSGILGPMMGTQDKQNVRTKREDAAEP